jgi:hypothetical protein
MKARNVILYVLGAVVLLGIGFAAGYFLTPAQGATLMMGGRAAPFIGHSFLLRGGGLMFFGLFRLLGGLGWLAGIVALILVLTRRNPQQQPAAPVSAETPTIPSDSTKSK